MKMNENIQFFDQMKDSKLLSWFDTTQAGEEVTIRNYELVQMENPEKEIENKWVVYFCEKEKGMVLNKTNRNTLIVAFGQEIDQSIGKKIILYYRDDIEFKGGLTKGLRLRKCSSKPSALPIKQLVA
jgi:hypothetical protein